MRTKYVNYMSLFIYYVFIDFFSVNCDCPFPISLQVGARCRTATSAKTRAWPTSCASRWGPVTIPTSRPRSWRMARWILASADPRSSSPGVCGWDRKRGGPMGPMGPQWGMGLRSVAKVMVGKNRCLNLMNWIMGGGVWKKGWNKFDEFDWTWFFPCSLVGIWIEMASPEIPGQSWRLWEAGGSHR
jgi:hypothetical protein